MYIFKKIFPKLKVNENIILGRWQINYSKSQLDRKIYLANHDNCGPCGYIDKLPKVNKNK